MLQLFAKPIGFERKLVGDGSYNIYLITHEKTGLQYVGQFHGDIQMRFLQHMNFCGSLIIELLLRNSYKPSEFNIQLLQSVSSRREANSAEAYFTRMIGTNFPFGMNIERAPCMYGKFCESYRTYRERGWDTSLLIGDLRKTNQKKTLLQDQIEKIAQFQRCELLDVDRNRRSSFSWARQVGTHNFIVDNNEKFMNGRKKLQDRRKNGGSTQMEKDADEKKKFTIKDFWSKIDKDKKSERLDRSLNRANERIRCPVCGIESNRSNITRYHIRGKCKDAFDKINQQN